MIQFDIQMINQLLQERRSIFPAKYSEEPVPRFIIEKMLENANWAPTHKFTEPWRFCVFSGEGLKKLGHFQAELYKTNAEKKGDFLENKYKTLLEKPTKCSYVISIGMHRDENEVVPEVEEISAVAMAIQNMYLTATAYGVGCYWGSGGITYMEEAKPFFNLGKNDRLLGFVFVGMPKGEWPSSKREPIDAKVKWIGE